MTPANAHTTDYKPQALNEPVKVAVQEVDGRPAAVQHEDWPQPRPVLDVLDRWRIDDEWWRDRPISRMYYVLIVEGDVRLTMYHDLSTREWFEQHDRARPQPPKPVKRRR